MLDNFYDESEFVDWLVEILGAKTVKGLHETGSLEDVKDATRKAWRLYRDLGVDGSRAEAARALLERLVPNTVDLELWQALAIGKNVHLPMATHYGRNSERVQPSHPAVKRPPRGNAYGKGHDKLDAPAQFFQRQAEAVAEKAAEIAELEEKLAAARERRAALEEGIQIYASTSLLTQLRKSVAPVFAAGPAWTVLRAIAGTTGNEVLETDRDRETRIIMVVLHALREHEQFEQELKRTILDVCRRYMGVAAERGKQFTEFDGPQDYEFILRRLGWPEADFDE